VHLSQWPAQLLQTRWWYLLDFKDSFYTSRTSVSIIFTRKSRPLARVGWQGMGTWYQSEVQRW
jgi:hypothetical protein